jgi:hypothetical protein
VRLHVNLSEVLYVLHPVQYVSDEGWLRAGSKLASIGAKGRRPCLRGWILELTGRRGKRAVLRRGMSVAKQVVESVKWRVKSGKDRKLANIDTGLSLQTVNDWK